MFSKYTLDMRMPAVIHKNALSTHTLADWQTSRLPLAACSSGAVAHMLRCKSGHLLSHHNIPARDAPGENHLSVADAAEHEVFTIGHETVSMTSKNLGLSCIRHLPEKLSIRLDNNVRIHTPLLRPVLHVKWSRTRQQWKQSCT